MNSVRQPAVAGLFYPGNRKELSSEIQHYLSIASETQPADSAQLSPKAIIVPHAGYIYSGATAAKAFITLKNIADKINRVILLGPSHRVHLTGLAITDVQYFRTPLGDVPIDTDSVEKILALKQVQVMDAAHWQEHSLEVQLPFLQTVLKGFQLVPLVVGDATTLEVQQVLDLLWGGPETLIVISSDLSHYHDYHTAQYIDRTTCEAIEHFKLDQIGFTEACGCIGMRALLRTAKQRQMKVHRLGLCNSGDTAGDQRRVVGYGSWAINTATV